MSKTLNINDWPSLIKKHRIILPTHHIVTRSSPDQITITSGWKRYILCIFDLIATLILASPLIVIIFFDAQDSPKYFGGLSKTVVVEVLLMLLMLFAFRKAMIYGKVTWKPGLDELTLFFSRWPFVRKISSPSTRFAVKLEMYMSNIPRARIRYGSYILSLYPTDRPEQKLILASTRNLCDARTALEALKAIVKNAYDETPRDKAAPLSESVLAEPALLAWNKLAARSQTKEPFLGELRTRWISAKCHSSLVIIKRNYINYVGVFILFALSGFMFYSLYSVSKSNFPKIIVFIPGIFVGTFFLIMGLKSLLDASRLTLNKTDSTMTIHYGFYPFSKRLTFPAGQISGRMYRCDEITASPILKPGHTVLSLCHEELPQTEFIIASSSKVGNISPFGQIIADFLNQPAVEEVTQNITLPDGGILQISSVSLTGGSGVLDSKRKFHIFSENFAVFSKSWSDVVKCVILSLLFIGFTIWGYLTDENLENESLKLRIILFVFLSLLFLLVMFMTVYAWLYRHILIDLKKNFIGYPLLLKSRLGSNRICRSDEVVAIQICSVLNSFVSSMTYEINIVRNDPDNQRTNIMISTDKEQTKSAALQFAEFLNVPLLDHT